MKIARTSLVALGLTAATALSAAPAMGAMAKPFDAFSGTERSPGNAHAYGTVQFERRGQAFIQGSLNDICPADGWWAQLEIWATYGKSGTFIPVRKIRDKTGCENPGKTFSFWTKPYKGKQINAIYMRVRECSDSEGVCGTDFETMDIRR